MTTDKKTIASLKSTTPKSYKNMDLDRLAVYALCVLEGKKVPLYFDYVAVAMFRLFPKKFSMANFSRYPDTNRISKTLRRLTDQTRKNWAIGSVENGFNLTDLGREIGKQVLELLNNPEKQGSHTKTQTRIRGRSATIETVEIKNSEAYKKWLAKEFINNYEFFSFLKATPYTPKPMLLDHIKKLRRAVSTANDNEATAFLEWLEKKFASLLK